MFKMFNTDICFPCPYVAQDLNMNWHVLLWTLSYFVCVLLPTITFKQTLKIFSDRRLHSAPDCLDIQGVS
jgi:hypothetical protein